MPRSKPPNLFLNGLGFGFGFTLIEMLVSITITAILTLLLVSLVGQASKLLIMGTNDDQYRERTRAALDYIGHDLRLASLSVNSSVSSLEFIINPPALAGSGSGPNSIFWQAPIATDTRLGAIAEVGYFVQWDTGTASPNPSYPRANLCRFLVNPANTAGAEDPNYLIYSNPAGWASNPGGWLSSTIVANVAPATYASNYQGLFLANVLGLWVQGYNADGSLYGTPLETVSSANPPLASHPLPAEVEVALVVLDSPTATRLTAPITSYPAGPLTGNSIAEGNALAFVSSLPPSIKSGASVISIKVPLDKYR